MSVCVNLLHSVACAPRASSGRVGLAEGADIEGDVRNTGKRESEEGVSGQTT